MDMQSLAGAPAVRAHLLLLEPLLPEGAWRRGWRWQRSPWRAGTQGSACTPASVPGVGGRAAAVQPGLLHLARGAGAGAHLLLLVAVVLWPLVVTRPESGAVVANSARRRPLPGAAGACRRRWPQGPPGSAGRAVLTGTGTQAVAEARL